MTKKEAFDFLDRMARGIAVMFGEQCETIVHEMDGQKVKNLAIYNGHVSGRTTGSTLSIYGRDTMMDEEDPKVNLDLDYVNQMVITSSGKTMKSSTFHFRGEDYHFALGINYDIEIVEQHHHNKLDAPSGTALMLADAINEENNGAYHYVYDRSSVRQKRDPKEIGISSVRGGSIVGDHEVLFCGPDEVITLRHTAYSRSIFANGAVNAAVYLAKKEPGLYDMGDLIAAF